MYAIERKFEIINILQTDNKVDVNTLSDRLKTSKETIRRDLKNLEDEGIIKRTHGGAIFNTNWKENETPLAVRSVEQYEEKNIICKKAASFIENDDTVFVDNSSTTQNIIRYINKNIHVTVITNSIQILIEYSKISNSNITIICLGGIFYEKNFSTYGSISQQNAKSFYPNKAFISCKGIDKNRKLTEGGINESDTKKIAIDTAKKVFLLADYTKFSSIGQVYLADFNSINTVITDESADISSLQYLYDYKIDLIIAKKDQ